MGPLDQGAVTQRDALLDRLNRAVAEIPPGLRALGRMVTGDAAERIVAESELGVDLLLMGSRGYGRVGRALVGSVAAQVIRGASCPVVVMPRGSPERPVPTEPDASAVGA
jgi:nucleotide-binding universal stress UspA family protein